MTFPEKHVRQLLALAVREQQRGRPRVARVYANGAIVLVVDYHIKRIAATGIGKLEAINRLVGTDDIEILRTPGDTN